MSWDQKPSFDRWMHNLAQASKSMKVEQGISASHVEKPGLVESEPAPIRQYKRQTSKKPSLEDVLKRLVLAQATDLARAGHYAEAERLLKENLSNLETMPAALDLLARICAQQRRFQDAYAFWTRALQFDSTNDAYKAGLSRLKEYWLSKRYGSHSAMGGGYSYLIYRLVLLLGPYIEKQNLGVVTLSHAGYEVTLPGEHYTVWEPDLAFVRTENIPVKDSPEWKRPWKLAPDLVVEVASPGLHRREVDQRAYGWIEQGVRLVWIIWPNSQTVDVWRPHYRRPVTTLKADGMLDGREVVPGFTCPLEHIFGSAPDSPVE